MEVKIHISKITATSLKLIYSEKAAKFDEVSNFKKCLEISLNLCSLLKIYELQCGPNNFSWQNLFQKKPWIDGMKPFFVVS